MNKIFSSFLLYSKSKEEKLNLKKKAIDNLKNENYVIPQYPPKPGIRQNFQPATIKAPSTLSLSLSYVQKKSHRRSSKTRCGRGRGGGSRGRKRGCRRRGRRRRRQGFQLDGANSDPEFILSISARWSGKELASSARRPLY